MNMDVNIEWTWEWTWDVGVNMERGSEHGTWEWTRDVGAWDMKVNMDTDNGHKHLEIASFRFRS